MASYITLGGGVGEASYCIVRTRHSSDGFILSFYFAFLSKIQLLYRAKWGIVLFARAFLMYI